MTVTIGEFFAGYGGLGMAVKAVLADSEVAWVSEIDDGACKVLAHRMPDAPNLGDITKIDWATIPRVHVATAGFPCQDVSAAGKRAGLVHGTRTGLWHATARAIAALRPDLVFLENVGGLLSARGDEPTSELIAAWAVRDVCTNLLVANSTAHTIAIAKGDIDRARHITARRVRIMGLRKRAVAKARRADALIVRALGTVLGTLADLGFDAEWICLRAADVGAPHGRLRIFIAAWPTADTERLRREPWRLAAPGQAQGGWSPAVTSRSGGVGDRADGLTLLPTPAVNDMGAAYTPDEWDLWTDKMKAAHQNGNGHGKSLNIEVQRLLPTPTTTQRGPDDAAEGREGAGPNLHNEVARLLPSPRAGSQGKSKRAMTASTGNGRRSGGGQSSPPGLDEVVALSEGHIPDHLPDYADLPPEARRIVDGFAASDTKWGEYGPAVERWEAFTRPAPPPAEVGAKGKPRLAPAFSEWMMGVPAGWITETPDVTRDEALKLCGNGVVPQQAAVGLTVLLLRAGLLEVAA